MRMGSIVLFALAGVWKCICTCRCMCQYMAMFICWQCVCWFGLLVSGVVAVSTAVRDGMKSCGQGEQVLGLEGILTLCL